MLCIALNITQVIMMLRACALTLRGRVLQLQMALEDAFTSQAQSALSLLSAAAAASTSVTPSSCSSCPSVILLHDRGLCDVAGSSKIPSLSRCQLAVTCAFTFRSHVYLLIISPITFAFLSPSFFPLTPFPSPTPPFLHPFPSSQLMLVMNNTEIFFVQRVTESPHLPTPL